MRTRSLGLGSTELITGNDMYGYYGKYTGICTPNELISLAGITQGTTKNDAHNNPNMHITWLKFSHNYKTLFVADRTIHYGVSWNHLNEKDLVFGKVVDFDGQKYLLRLMQGANANPTSLTPSNPNSNSEWDSLICQFTPDTNDSHWAGASDPVVVNSSDATLIQETSDNGVDYILYRGVAYVHSVNQNYYKRVQPLGYRPVLEVL